MPRALNIPRNSNSLVEKGTPRSSFISFRQSFVPLRQLSKMSYSSISNISTKFKFAAIQMEVSNRKEENLRNARERIREAALHRATVVALPECFNCPYSVDSFGQFAENLEEKSSPSFLMLCEAAKENHVYLIGGSLPEIDLDSKLYNTCLVFSPDGRLLAKHRKVHLFDIDIPGKITFQESKVLNSGRNFTMFETEYCKIGLGICYDIRFPEMGIYYSKQGCKMICYPGAFNMTTGPAHWKLLQRSRALDNQLYVATISPARNKEASYQAWGHSSIVDPWGDVIATTEHSPAIVYADIDLKRVDEVREQIPTSKQKRTDLYELVHKLN